MILPNNRRNKMKQYNARFDVTIGNGKGQFSFSTRRSYTENFLRNCALTAAQIKHYFQAKK